MFILVRIIFRAGCLIWLGVCIDHLVGIIFQTDSAWFWGLTAVISCGIWLLIEVYGFKTLQREEQITCDNTTKQTTFEAVTTKASKKRDWTFIHIILISIGCIALAFLLFSWSSYEVGKSRIDDVVLESIKGNIVAVRASHYARSEYIIRQANWGCIRVGKTLVPVYIGEKEYYPPHATNYSSRYREKMLIHSFRCVTRVEADRIAVDERRLNDTAEPGKTSQEATNSAGDKEKP